MLTVQQAAEKIGITPQAIYKKINKQLLNELKPFVVDVKRGKRHVKMIKTKGVEIIINSLEQPVVEDDDEMFNNDEQQLLNLLEENIQVLREQLKEKDEQLVEKDKQLEKKDKQIERLGDMIEQSNILLKNNQALMKIQHEQKALIEQTIEEKFEETEPEVKKGLFDRIFNRSKD